MVLWQPGLDPRAVAGLASRRTYPLRSSFAPTYNMAVNLVGSVGRDRARRTLLEQSFAQFQSDRSVVGVARPLARNTEAIADDWAEAACDRGDFEAYARLRAEIAAVEAAAARERSVDRRAEALQTLSTLKPGDIVRVPGGKNQGWAVVIDPGTRAGDRDNPATAGADRGPAGPPAVAHRLPDPAAGRGADEDRQALQPEEPASRRNLGAALPVQAGRDRSRSAPGPGRRGSNGEVAEQIAGAAGPSCARHPCHNCPDREQHARRAEKALRWSGRTSGRRSGWRRGPTPSPTTSTRSAWCSSRSATSAATAADEVTDAGRMLARIYAELDLVAAECIRAGRVLDADPATAGRGAGRAWSTSRGAVDEGVRKPRMPDGQTEATMTQVRRIWREVSLVERDARLSRGPEPDIGFSEVAYGWAAGRSAGRGARRRTD